MHCQTGRAFASQGNVFLKLRRKDSQASLSCRKKKWDLVNPESHFPSALSLPFANVNSGCAAFPLTSLYFLAGRMHLWGQIPFPCWCSDGCQEHTGCRCPFQHAVLPAHCPDLLPSPWLFCLVLAASPHCLSHPGHKLFIRATEHHHKPHSFTHASASKCRDGLCRGDTGNAQGTRILLLLWTGSCVCKSQQQEQPWALHRDHPGALGAPGTESFTTCLKLN